MTINTETGYKNFDLIQSARFATPTPVQLTFTGSGTFGAGIVRVTAHMRRLKASDS